MNGVQLGHGLRSRYSSTQIIQLLSNNMRMNVCRRIIDIQSKISIIIDECTTVSTKTTLIIYLKCQVEKNLYF